MGEKQQMTTPDKTWPRGGPQQLTKHDNLWLKILPNEYEDIEPLNYYGFETIIYTWQVN